MSSGLIDTSVVVEWDDGAVQAALPDEVAISTFSLAELAAGPHLASNASERARRQARLQQAEGLFEPLDFDRAAARSFGLIVATIVAARPSHRIRIADLLIAAVAHANGLDLYTRNPRDLAGLDALLVVNSV